MRRRAAFLGKCLHDPAVGLLRATESRLVAQHELPAPRLDLGCGDGSFALWALSGPTAVGLDRDPVRARKALASGAYQSVVIADARQLPFLPSVFASVLSNSTLEHLPGIDQVLREMAVVLKPSGTLLFTVHNHRFARRMFLWPRLFKLLGQPDWCDAYRDARAERLAMRNLFNADEWRQRLGDAGFVLDEVRPYLGGRAERAFEVLLVVARFGLGRFNLAAALRIVSRALDHMGVELHRRLAGRVLERALRGILDDPKVDAEGEHGAAYLLKSRVTVPAAIGVKPRSTKSAVVEGRRLATAPP